MIGRYLKIFLPALAGLVLVFSVALNLNQQVVASSQDKVTICHRTNSVTNPYVTIQVDKNAADGIAGNSGHTADHYGEHQGPLASSQSVAQSLKDSHTEWGDIIPPISPHHNGLNWTSEGQAMYNNDCNYVTSSPTPTPSPSPSVSPSPSPSPTPSPSSQPSPTPSPSPEPCDDDPGFWGQWSDHHDPCASPSPSPSPEPCDDTQFQGEWWDDEDGWHHKHSPTPCPSPSPEPSPSPTTPPQGGPGGGPEVGGNITTPQCPSDRPQKVDQVWFSDIKPGQVTVHWANKGDAYGYHIAYGPAADNLPWGVEVGNVSEVTLNDLPGGDLWVTVTAKSSADCGGPTSDPVKVAGQVLGVQPQVLGATGVADTALPFSAGFGLIALGLWQAQTALAKREQKA